MNMVTAVFLAFCSRFQNVFNERYRFGEFYRLVIRNLYLIAGKKDVSQILYVVLVTITGVTRTFHPSLANVPQGLSKHIVFVWVIHLHLSSSGSYYAVD